MMTRKQTIAVAVAALLTAAAGLAQDLQPVTPEVRIVGPLSVPNQMEAVTIATSPTFTISGTYADQSEDIWHYRTLLKPAQLPDGSYVDTRYGFYNAPIMLVPFDDAQWSEWRTWDLGEEAVAIAYSDLPVTDAQGERIAYVFAAQVMASDGTVSFGRVYGQSVANFYVSTLLSPVLAVVHPLLGAVEGAGEDLQAQYDLLPGLEGEFRWQAHAEQYGSQVASYRWGWDLTDPDDPDDPNWALPPGLSDAHRRAGPITFADGIHTLTIDARDAQDNLTRLVMVLSMVPVPDYPEQRPLLLVDDVKDRNSFAWPDAQGIPLDQDDHRDAFWLDVLGGAGGVAGFQPQQDVVDTEADQLGVRDLVDYRAVAWSGRWVASPGSQTSRLRPLASPYGPVQVQYNWLGAYQQQGGNLLQVGSQAALDHLPDAPYVMPVVFDSAEGNAFGMEFIPGENLQVRVGFGENQLGDAVYPSLYPYRNLGLAAVDVVSPSRSVYAPDGRLVRQVRKSACTATKALVLDADFVAANMPGGPTFADTIATEASIDWWDDPYEPTPYGNPASDVLAVAYIWSNDEFYDADIIDRGVPIVPQDCDGEPCIEPLFRTLSRLDWVRGERQADDPDDTWPQGDYGGAGQPDLDALCGQLALVPDRTSARTNARVTGFVTHRFRENKPSGAGDVVLGFDPYRFDHGAMKQALRWILGEHFGLTMRSP